MKKITAAIICLALMGSLSACGGTKETAEATPERAPAQETGGAENGTESTVLQVRFGDEGEAFPMRLEENNTARTLAEYAAYSEWRLPIYSFDESDVMQYYDIPGQYEIPSAPETVTEARAGEVFLAEGNRVVLYYHDAEVSEEYTKIGSFDATEEFVEAVENNPVLEGWGNQIIIISAAE